MSEQCRADELRTLFLFEHLSDSQLEILCAEGRIETFPAGVLVREGDPARCFYVMIDGELVMSGRMGGIDVQTRRTSQRGAYCGAWVAYIPDAAQVYDVSIQLTRSSRFFVLDAERFAGFMQSQFPMAVHLLAGHTLGAIRQQQLLGQRARLTALGTITAGLTHHLNNPAAAVARAATDLAGVLRRLQRRATPPDWADLHADAVEHAGSGPRIGPLELSDREQQIGDWLQQRGVAAGWDHAPTFAEAGLDVGWLQRMATAIGEPVPADELRRAVELLTDCLDGELRLRDITEASKRISALLEGAKHYSQMDRGDIRQADIHELLNSTLLMFQGRIGPGSGIALITQWDPSIPEIGCHAGDLNQVWTNLIENALEAMRGRGTLTVRTAREGDDMVCVQICDDGPGIAPDIVDHVFTAFFTTKPAGEGNGLGLDLAWRIIERHGGNLSVSSVPGDTRFSVRLPVHLSPLQ
ncbi:ATP-binding protein [Mycolicibacterium cosmeticum]|uniref:ATP-binding protein n=1 Tax=Mycolicibacterium cosmeticum TaxID=258533 RepID=UPI00320473A7